jgi:RNA polymerase sigma-70 factor (ECF subfamily)
VIHEDVTSNPGAGPDARESFRDSPPASASPTAPAERWLAEHGDILWRFILARTRSPDIAEEIVQETLLAAIQAHATFQGTSSERTWLLGIAAHKVADHFRALRRRAERAPEPPAADASPGAFTIDGMWAKPPKPIESSTAPENAELLAALRHCLNTLPPSQAEAIWLRDLLNIPAAEVCKAMGVTPTNLWSRIHRARAALRLCVEKSVGTSKDGAP